jgi:hypothetical protein
MPPPPLSSPTGTVATTLNVVEACADGAKAGVAAIPDAKTTPAATTAARLVCGGGAY